VTVSKIPTGPVVLELAPMPREQIGPFLLLGLDKTADKAVIDANWAQRIKWARRNQLKAPLEDINWARDLVSDLDKRIRADAASFNIDTTEGVLRRLTERYENSQPTATCRPLDVEKNLADYTPPAELPDLGEARAAVVVPEVPQETPAVAHLLEQFFREPLDPWQVNLP
jgi:hypothetical protein